MQGDARPLRCTRLEELDNEELCRLSRILSTSLLARRRRGLRRRVRGPSRASLETDLTGSHPRIRATQVFQQTGGRRGLSCAWLAALHGTASLSAAAGTHAAMHVGYVRARASRTDRPKEEGGRSSKLAAVTAWAKHRAGRPGGLIARELGC